MGPCHEWHELRLFRDKNHAVFEAKKGVLPVSCALSLCHSYLALSHSSRVICWFVIELRIQGVDPQARSCIPFRADR